MALTVVGLREALRAGDSHEENSILARLLGVAVQTVTRHAPTAPEDVRDEAAVRLAGYLYDQPNAGRGVGYGHALRNSGAAALLLPWREHRAGVIA